MFSPLSAMATCPRCKGHLTENHRCPRSRGRIVFETGLAAIGGGLFTLLVLAILDPHAQSAFDALLLVIGGLLGIAADRFFRRR
jgi:hypothetical protein